MGGKLKKLVKARILMISANTNLVMRDVIKPEQWVSEVRAENGIATTIGMKRLMVEINIKIKEIKMFKNLTKKFFDKILFLLISIIPISAFAGGETPVSDGLRYITNAMYGATGLAIATIAIMVVGLLCLGHFLKWVTLGYTIIGISIIFGAGSIVNGITSLVRNI